MLDKEKFITLITGLCELYKQTPSQFIFDLYYDIFKNYNYETVAKAVRQVIATHKYNTLPKPADILEFLEGSKDDKALIAWLQVKEALDKGDYYKSIEFTDPVISHCINSLGGWMEFSELTMLKKDMPFVEKRFIDLYRLFLKREITKPQRITGFIEAKNREKGYLKSIPEPLQINKVKQPNPSNQKGLTNGTGKTERTG